jgi:pyridoxal phosphate enzyme (YggS family)
MAIPGSLVLSPDQIAANLAEVRLRIARACARSSRRPDDVRLVAISKTHSTGAVAAAIAAGQLDFGENQVQEALTKIPEFAGQGLHWHFIGHLQSNKAKFLPGNFQWLHTLDSMELAQKLSRAALERRAVVNCLIQVNVTGDPRKSGIATEAVAPLLEQLLEQHLVGISLRGLMTIGPQRGGDVELRGCFAQLRGLQQRIHADFDLDNFDQLSMGMTGDMEQAIAEGATMVRVGSAIFGER